MSVVSALFWHAAGTVRGPPPGPVSSHPPGPVSSGVHTCEDQRDQQDDDEHKQPSAGEAGEAAGKPPCRNRDTGQHYPAPAKKLPGGQARSLTIRLEYRAVYLLKPGSPADGAAELAGLDLRHDLLLQPLHVVERLRNRDIRERRPEEHHRQPGLLQTLEIVGDLARRPNQ